MSPLELQVGIDFTGDQVVLTVRGDLDLVTGSKLGALVAALVGGGHHRLVLELAGCGFIDVAGIRVVSDAARTVAALDGELSIRSPSDAVRRLVVLTRQPMLAALIEPEPSGASLGAVEASPPRRVGTAPIAVLRHLQRVAAIPTEDFVVDAALRLVMTLAVALVGRADGASVSLRRRGRLATVAASDRTISAMDADQYATGEGPCVDASVEGRWFHTAALAAEARWPAFTPRARALGISAILSSPLSANGQPIGALNIYSRTTSAFMPADQQLAAVLAAEASTMLTGSGVDTDDDVVSERLTAALHAREAIHLAQGIVMERHGMDQDSAYRSLRRSSVHTGLPLSERAAAMIATTQTRLDSAPPRSPG